MKAISSGVGCHSALGLSLLLAGASLAHAATPSYAERVEEIRAILDDVHIFRLASPNELDSIVWEDGNHYRVQWQDSEYSLTHGKARTCSIEVHIIGYPAEAPPGRKLHVAVDSRPVACKAKKL
jgi:hypothetical protein